MKKLSDMEQNFNNLVDVYENMTQTLQHQHTSNYSRVAEHNKKLKLQNEILRNKVKVLEDKLRVHVESKNDVFAEHKKETKTLRKSVQTVKEAISSKLDHQFNTLKLCADKLNEHCDRQLGKNKELERTLKQKLAEFQRVLDSRDVQAQTHENLIMGLISKERIK